jgi:hypothetical protein
MINRRQIFLGGVLGGMAVQAGGAESDPLPYSSEPVEIADWPTGNIRIGYTDYDVAYTIQPVNNRVCEGSVAMGRNAAGGLTGQWNGAYSVHIDHGSGAYSNGSYCGTGVGLHALLCNNSPYNTAFGADALKTHTEGNANTAIGAKAMYADQTGYYSAALGIWAFGRATHAPNCTAIGALPFIPPDEPVVMEPQLVLPPEPTEPERLPGISDEAWALALTEYERQKALHSARVEWARAQHEVALKRYEKEKAEAEADYRRRYEEALREHEAKVRQAEEDRARAARAGKRHHAGIFANRELERLRKLGIDFAGLQDHSFDGQGEDVVSVSYQAYIAPIAVIQQKHRREIAEFRQENAALRQMVEALEERLQRLETVI